MSGTVPPSVDQIQSAQITTLVSEVTTLINQVGASQSQITALQSQITALQSDVATIKQELISGPPGWSSNWPIDGVPEQMDELTSFIKTALANTGQT